MSNGIFPIARAANGDNDWSHSSSAAKVGTAGLVLKAAAGRLARIDAVNGAATAYFLMVFNKATAPVNTDVPILTRRLPASSEVSLSLADIGGIYCANGISFAISTTDGALTLAVANDLSYAAWWK